MTDTIGHRAWDQVRAQLCAAEHAAVVSVPRRRGFPHPREAGARLTSTWPVGQVADYVIEGQPPLAVREFADRWEVFVDNPRAAQQLLCAVEHSPSAAVCIGAAMIGGALGASMSNKREGLLLGAGLGLLFAAALTGGRRPRT